MTCGQRERGIVPCFLRATALQGPSGAVFKEKHRIRFVGCCRLLHGRELGSITRQQRKLREGVGGNPASFHRQPATIG